MEKQRGRYAVEKMCKVLKVSPNAYYNWRKNKDKVPSKRTKDRQRLMEKIEQIWMDSQQTYGSPRLKKALEKEGFDYSISYVARLMKELNIASIRQKKWVCTTDSKHDLPVAENLLKQDFRAEKLGEKWVSDITYVKVNQNWNYLTTVIDLADRKIIGWSFSTDMYTTSTVLPAWSRAIQNRKPSKELIFHSDRGSQYASELMCKAIAEHPTTKQSMSGKGNCYDNAVAESFFKTIKSELINHCKYQSYQQAYLSIHNYIENFYNSKRLHSSLGYKTPNQMEKHFKLNSNQKIS